MIKTLYDRNIDRLDSIVNDHITNKGYKLCGDLIIHDLPIGDTEKKEPVYFQRVIQEKLVN